MLEVEARKGLSMTDRVFYAKAVYGSPEIEAVTRVLEEAPTALMNGPRVAEFESLVALGFGKQHGLMVNSGSSANLLALAGLELEKGGEIVTPALTFATTVAPIVQLGFVPSFVDVTPGTFNVDCEQVEEAITARTVAMMIPNLIGNLPDWQRLREIADRHDLPLIEDSADTLGASFAGEPTGTYASISTTSFYASHVVTGAGFGGMVASDDRAAMERARLLRGWGRDSSIREESESVESRFGVAVDGVSYDAKFVFSALGYNFLPSELSAAFGLVQLRHLKTNIEHRRANFSLMRRMFSRWGELFDLPVEHQDAHTGWLAFPLVVKPSAPFSRTDLQVALERSNIQTRVVFTGNILRQPAMAGVSFQTRDAGFPVADDVMRGGLLLGCHHGMGEREVELIEAAVERFVES